MTCEYDKTNHISGFHTLNLLRYYNFDAYFVLQVHLYTTGTTRVSNSYDQPQLPPTKMAPAENGEFKHSRSHRFRPSPSWLVVTAVGRNCYSPVNQPSLLAAGVGWRVSPHCFGGQCHGTHFMCLMGHRPRYSLNQTKIFIFDNSTKFDHECNMNDKNKK